MCGWVGGKQKTTTQHDFHCGKNYLISFVKTWFTIVMSPLVAGSHQIVDLTGSTKHEKSDRSTLVVIYVVSCSIDTYVKQIPKNLGKGPISFVDNNAVDDFSVCQKLVRVNCLFGNFS